MAGTAVIAAFMWAPVWAGIDVGFVCAALALEQTGVLGKNQLSNMIVFSGDEKEYRGNVAASAEFGKILI